MWPIVQLAAAPLRIRLLEPQPRSRSREPTERAVGHLGSAPTAPLLSPICKRERAYIRARHQDPLSTREEQIGRQIGVDSLIVMGCAPETAQRAFRPQPACLGCPWMATAGGQLASNDPRSKKLARKDDNGAIEPREDWRPGFVGELGIESMQEVQVRVEWCLCLQVVENDPRFREMRTESGHSPRRKISADELEVGRHDR